MGKYRFVIIGGGAAGFFGAINAALKAQETKTPLEVIILESSAQYLKKVKISGGGRCNVTHNLFEPKLFSQNYPRGERELLSPLQRFQAQDTVKWFKEQGIHLVAEDDGRMFPESNVSQTIIDCYLDLAEKLDIQLLPKHPVREIQHQEDGSFLIQYGDKSLSAHGILIATGSGQRGYDLAQSLGHQITERAPSLFSFKINHPLIQDLQGLSFPEASIQLKIQKKKWNQQGPVLITHWGLSGPAVLKLSAWAAREMKNCQYEAQVFVSWLGKDRSLVESRLIKAKEKSPKVQMKNHDPLNLPKRFWIRLLENRKIDPSQQWAHLDKKSLNGLIEDLTRSELKISGQNRYKDEFVECGGVSLKEINFKTMESRIVPNLYFAGEILDVDGITGGFNFQNAWTTSWICAQSVVDKLKNDNG